MSLIQCTNDCKFQEDGYCHLEKAGMMTDTPVQSVQKDCLYYQQAKKRSERPESGS